jgi:hypothetical protein
MAAGDRSNRHPASSFLLEPGSLGENIAAIMLIGLDAHLFYVSSTALDTWETQM